MPLMSTPDLGSNRRLALVALAVTLCVWAVLTWICGDINRTLGDTDDAMRLARVHDLLAGQGWFDQRVPRLQPPLGSMMHWSRLLDGALAGMDWLLSRVVSAAAAEWAMRFVWPLLWIGPAVACGLVIARRLGGGGAVLIAAMLLLLDLQLYVQFRPGRIDHHNIQIVMALTAAACAMAGGARARWAALAGAATALGLAIGIEALAFLALIGASYGLRAGLCADQARPARAYGLALAGTGLACFLAQTPPSLWSAPACDSLASNLVAALVVGGLGLSAASLAERAPTIVRLGLIAAAGLGAGVVYLAMDPLCLHGPFAAIDPRLRPVWLDRIQELRNWPTLWRLSRDTAILSISMVAMGAVSAAYLLVRRWRKPDPAILLAAALVALAGLAAAQALRLNDYAFWFGAPVVAAALNRIVERWLKGALVGALAVSSLFSPVAVTLFASKLAHAAGAPATDERAAKNAAPCFDTKAYAPLAVLPPGLVLAPIDLGPFVLAQTRDTVLSAPYHRMAWGILAAYDALNAKADAAQARIRTLNIRYVVDCSTDLSTPVPGGLTDDLRKQHVPAWLRALSGPGQTLRIYAVEAAPKH